MSLAYLKKLPNAKLKLKVSLIANSNKISKDTQL